MSGPECEHCGDKHLPGESCDEALRGNGDGSVNCDICGMVMRRREKRTVQRCPECRDQYNKMFEIALATRLAIYSENWMKAVKDAEAIAEAAMKSRTRDAKEGGRGV